MAKKRSRGEGSVHRTKTGRWVGQLMDGYTDDGKRKIVSFSADTKGDVLIKMQEYKDQASQDVRIDRTLSLADWGNTWYVDHQSQVQASTYAGYRYTLNLISKELGNRKICEVLPLHINRFMDGLVKKGYSMSQIRKCRAMLIQIFRSAEANGLIEKNPAIQAKIIRNKSGTIGDNSQEKDAFTYNEFLSLWNSLPFNLIGNSIRLMLCTGLRIQEVLALGPDDIAEDGSTISVTKAIKIVDATPMMGPPKSKRSYRTIPVPERFQPIAMKLRDHGMNGLIWYNNATQPYFTVSAFRHRFYSAISQIDGVRRLSPHCCRHTYITNLQAAGVSIDLIARLAGHSSFEVTDSYTHTREATLSSATAALNTTILKEVSPNDRL